MRLLITGGCGFVGTNLALECLRRGERLCIVDNLYREGSAANLAWLREHGSFAFYQADVRDAGTLAEIVETYKPEVIFHLAGQVAMTTSVRDPRLDFETNVVGTFNLLEAVRQHAAGAAVVYSSSNKVYGDLEHIRYEETATRYVAPEYPQGFDETLPLSFHSPYGCSKGAADQYMLDYARMYRLKTVVFRHSTIFGERQFATEDQGWIGWFVRQGLERARGAREPFTICGNGKQVRDVLFATDLVRCYYTAVEHIEEARGEAFNIGGGAENSLSLLELFAFVEKELGVRMEYRQLPPRASDQKVFIANNGKAGRVFGWQPALEKETGVRNMIRWMSGHE